MLRYFFGLVMPPSAEGGGFCVAKEENIKNKKIYVFLSPSVSFADSSLIRGSLENYNKHYF